MTSRLYRDQEPRSGLPNINSRPYSAGSYNNGYDIRRSSTLDSLDRQHVKFADSYVGGRQNLNEQSQDQVKYFKDEIARKDRLLSQMSRGNGYSNHFDESLIKTSSNHNLNIQPANDFSYAQIRELEIELNIRDETIRKLQSTIDICRDTEGHHLALIQQLRRELVASSNLQLNSGSHVEVNNDYSQQEVFTNSQQRIGDLESRLRTHLEERERAEQERVSVERRLQELTLRLTNLFYLDANSMTLSSENIIQKAEEMVQENTMLRGKVSTLKQLVGEHEEEIRANRETIVRLSAEAERVQNFVSKSSLEVDNMKVERDCALSKREDLEREIDLLKERLETSQRAWSTMKRELEDARLRQHANEIDTKWLPSNNSNAEAQQRFRENIARLLSDAYVVTDPYEEAIVARIQNLLMALRDKNARIEIVEKQLSELMNQIHLEQDLTRQAERKCKHAEANVLDLEDKLRRVNVTGNVDVSVKNGYNAAQERYVRLLDEIVTALKMPPLCSELTIEAATQQVLRYAERCAAQDRVDSALDQTEMLGRKINSLKEQLTLKDRQIDELRDHLSNAEQKLACNSEKEEEYSRNRKLTKLLDKYKIELNEAHLEIRQLKSKLLEACDINSQAMSKARTLESMESKLEHLEEVRRRQKDHINNIEDSLQTVSSISNELKKVKAALAELSQQNKQLLDLRHVISRMLGLDSNATTVADLEIVGRLEKLIVASANGNDIKQSFILDGIASGRVADQFRRGYFEQETPRGERTRARSVSPVKKRDTKVY